MKSSGILFRAALFGAFVIISMPCHGEAAVQTKKVVVLPLSFAGSGEYSYLGPAVENVLTSRIASLEGIALVAPYLSEARPSLRPMNQIEQANADYGLTGSIAYGGEGVEVTLIVIGKDSPVPVISRTFSGADSIGLIPFIESFAEQASDVIKKSAKQEPRVAETGERPTLLAPVPGDEGPEVARMHPDRMFRAGGVAPSGRDVLAGPVGDVAGWTVQESWPEGVPRPTIGDGGQAEGTAGREGGRVGLEGVVPDFPTPEERPVLVSSAPPRSESPGLLARLLPGDWGRKKPLPGSGPYGGLPYPSPEDLEAASQREAQTHAPLPQASSAVSGGLTRQGTISMPAPPDDALPTETSTSIPETMTTLPPPSQPQQERRGWLPRLFAFGKGDKGGKAPAEQAVPPTTKSPKAPSEGGGVSGPIWQWY